MQSVCCCHLLPFLIGNSMQSVCCCHPLPFLIGNTHQCVWGGVGGGLQLHWLTLCELACLTFDTCFATSPCVAMRYVVVPASRAAP